MPEPYYGPAFHDQPMLAIGKVHHVGEPVAVVLATDPHVAEEARAADRRRVRGTAGGVRRGRGGCEPGAPRARRAQAGRHLSPISSISRAGRTPTSRSTPACGTAMSTRPSPRPTTSSSTRSGPGGDAHAARADRRRSPSRDNGVTIHTARRARRSCGWKSRGCSAGRRTACASGAVSRRRLRRQALHQARGAGRVRCR